MDALFIIQISTFYIFLCTVVFVTFAALCLTDFIDTSEYVMLMCILFLWMTVIVLDTYERFLIREPATTGEWIVYIVIFVSAVSMFVCSVVRSIQIYFA